MRRSSLGRGPAAPEAASAPRRFRGLDRNTLLLGTALASTLLVGTLAAPTPASAVVATCVGQVGPTIDIANDDPIICFNTEARTGGPFAISLETPDAAPAADGQYIFLDSSGILTATSAGSVYGIYALSGGDNSSITVMNRGGVVATSTADSAFGILAETYGDFSRVKITNLSAVRVRADDEGYGIQTYTEGDSSRIKINNTGDLEVRSGGEGYGIRALTEGDASNVAIVNSGAINVTSLDYAFGIFALTEGTGSGISIINSGDINANFGSSPLYAGNDAISAISFYGNITITNSGALKAATDGIYATSGYGKITVVNHGPIQAESHGIHAGLGLIANAGRISITNTGRIEAGEIGILAGTYGGGLVINNSGDIDAGIIGITALGVLVDIEITNTATIDPSVGIIATITGFGNSIDIDNQGTVAATNLGLAAFSAGFANSIVVNNSGSVKTSGTDTVFDYTSLPYCGCNLYGFSFLSGGSIGIAAGTAGVANSITIVNSGKVEAFGRYGTGIAAVAYNYGYGPASRTTIVNSGSVYGSHTGIYSVNADGTTIINTGDISAGSQLAINVLAGPATIFNSGVITGFVLLDADDNFINQAGGLFEARLTSDFDATGTGGNDLFRNQAGGTVHVGGSAKAESAAFVNLDRFENAGLISMVDGGTGDSFTLSNTPGDTDLDFAASGHSTLAADAFLGGPGNSSSDIFTIEGDVSGVTTVQINNVNAGPGVFNPAGIPVVFVTGETPNPDAFQLAAPIDTGFFAYDLFFTPTGSGFWELRSFPGGGAFLLPQLVTAAQDIWHQSASTWFDRTADLRVLLAGGPAPAAYDPGGKSLSAPYPLTPAVWVRGSGGWLDRDASARTTAYGRNYTFDLDRDLETIDFQVGVDMGKRDVLTSGDALVFGLLGGFVHGGLDYDALARQFDFNGGQAGAYATYLNGGLFVDTLANVHLYSLETSTLGFPDSLDANTMGVRTDTGYRFGSFRGGPFLEPLATLEVMWADIDGFSLGGNTVSFEDEANVRGRLGLRAGTTMAAWDGTIMEPFVIGSLWSNLTGDNQATLVSTGRSFRFEDRLEDVWGEISAGVNFFNLSQTTAVFAKVDVAFGDDLTGVGGKAGMRVSW